MTTRDREQNSGHIQVEVETETYITVGRIVVKQEYRILTIGLRRHSSQGRFDGGDRKQGLRLQCQHHPAAQAFHGLNFKRLSLVTVYLSISLSWLVCLIYQGSRRQTFFTVILMHPVDHVWSPCRISVVTRPMLLTGGWIKLACWRHSSLIEEADLPSIRRPAFTASQWSSPDSNLRTLPTAHCIWVERELATPTSTQYDILGRVDLL